MLCKCVSWNCLRGQGCSEDTTQKTISESRDCVVWSGCLCSILSQCVANRELALRLPQCNQNNVVAGLVLRN